MSTIILTGCNQQPLDNVCREWLSTSKESQRLDADFEHWKTERTLEQATPKTWATLEWAPVGMKALTLETKWRAGELLYKFAFAPGNASAVREAESRLRAMGSPPQGFQITLLDADGFQAFTFFVALRDMPLTSDSKMREAIGAVACLPAAYAAASVGHGWQVRTVMF
jgi:hypothetical protein